jgi:hypothetical protein
MDLSTLIKEIWDKFVVWVGLETPEPPKSLKFGRDLAAGNWRTGIGLWSGVLPLFSTRVYYLEITRTSIADKRELGIKPPPSHTFKLFYFSKTESAKQRITVFVVYKNCFLPSSSEDYVAIEDIGKALYQHLSIISERSYVSSADTISTEVIQHAGRLPQIKLKDGGQGIPSITLLGRSSKISSDYWQKIIDEEFQKVKDKRLEESRRKGFR